mgnify:CR=1 FL=1|tara:strand:- start:2180 stop:2692 length:513 start_codon:yes stop_codon:yes gene_type:complete
MEKNPKIKQVVTLKVFKGEKISFNEDRSIQNDSQLIKTEHGTNEWKCLMMTLVASGYCKVEVLRVNNIDSNFSEVEDKKSYQKEVESSLNPFLKVELTPDQKRIAELEAKLEAFISNKEPKKEVELDNEEDDKESLKELQLEYFELFGKKAHHMMKAERLIEEIDNFKNK